MIKAIVVVGISISNINVNYSIKIAGVNLVEFSFRRSSILSSCELNTV